MGFMIGQATNLYKPVGERILEKLHDYFGGEEGEFKAYFYGDPFAIPVSQLPCIIVDVDEEKQELGPTGMDRITTTLVIKVVLNKRDDYGGDTAISVTKKKLMTYMSARDATTQQYLPETVMGIIRQYLTMNNELVNLTSDIKYGMLLRPGGTDVDTLTTEAQVTIETQELIVISGRT
jgi:hypothetical protein